MVEAKRTPHGCTPDDCCAGCAAFLGVEPTDNIQEEAREEKRLRDGAIEEQDRAQGMKSTYYTIQSQEPFKPWVPSFLTNILATLGRVKRFVIIDPDGAPYLERITLRERPDGSATMLHMIYKSDDDRGLHDHPWDFAATLIHGAYRNHVHMPKAPKPDTKRDYTAVASSAGAPDLYQPHGIMPGPYQKSYIMQRGVYHRLELLTDIAVTLVEHGPKLGEWGFLVDDVHVPHEQYIREKYGQKGDYQGDGTTRIT